MRASVIATALSALSFGFWSVGAQADTWKCAPYPQFEAASGDPTAAIYVSFAGGVWSVVHVTASGALVHRELQYDLTDTSGAMGLSWTGTLKRNIGVSMHGSMVSVGSNLDYVEVLTLGGGAPRVVSRASCSVAAPTGVPQLEAAANPLSGATTSVALSMQSGIYLAPVRINGAITLRFVVDSGASDVAIPADVATTLVRTGTLTGADFVGNGNSTLADGSVIADMRVRIRELAIGGLTVSGVEATISPAKGELLLGESFLRRFRSWSIDNSTSTLTLR